MRPVPTGASSLSWLLTLKAAQLHRLALATGISSSGSKPALIRRFVKELQSPPPIEKSTRTMGESSLRPTSILSIDMGIRNLAYAHLRIDPPSNDNDTTSPTPTRPTLNAWTRFSIAPSPGISPKLRNETSASDRSAPPLKKESFDPETYALHAYNLILTLLRDYSPTHILIERQRFRSGGAAAVQEWALRVGVFEGMLYAVLRTIAEERKWKEEHWVEVEGVEPKRVGAYWLGGVEGGGVKEMLKGKEGKKAKIDVVGRWLGDVKTKEGEGKVVLDRVEGEGGGAGRTVGAFLRSWKGKNGKELTGDGEQGKEKKKTVDPAVKTDELGKVAEIGKLDDLADCLLQGMAWIEWRRMRERVFREGWKALETDENREKEREKTAQAEGKKVREKKVKTKRERRVDRKVKFEQDKKEIMYQGMERDD